MKEILRDINRDHGRDRDHTKKDTEYFVLKGEESSEGN